MHARRLGIVLTLYSIILVLSFSSLSFSQAPAAVGYTYRGDINEDGNVNIFDLLGMLSMLSNPEGTTERAKQIADMDESESVNIFDLLGMLSVLSGAAEPGIIYWGPVISGLSSTSAAVGDTLTAYLENINEEISVVDVKAQIDVQDIEILDFTRDSVQVIIPTWFTGGQLKLLVANDTTNLMYCYFQVRQQVQAAESATVNIRDEITLEVAANTFSEEVSLTVEEADTAIIPLPVEMGTLGTPVALSITDTQGRSLPVDTLSTDSIRVSFNVEGYTGDLEDVAVAYLTPDSLVRYFEGSFTSADNQLSASIPVNIIGEEQDSSAQLQRVEEVLNLGWVAVVKLSNYFCKAEGKLTPSTTTPSGKIPVIFIHGVNLFEQLCSAGDESFTSLRAYLGVEMKKDGLEDKFQLYGFSYPTFYSPEQNAEVLKEKIDALFPTERNDLAERNDIVLVCHSMGGLVARYYMEELYCGELYCGSKVQRIITSGTLHRGVPFWPKIGSLLFPTEGVKSLDESSELIQKLVENEETIDKDKYITYAGSILYTDEMDKDVGEKKFVDKVLIKIATIYGKLGLDSDGIVTNQSGILDGVYKNSLFVGYNHFEMHDGDREKPDNDPLFVGIYEDLKELLHTVSGTVALVDGSGLEGVTVTLIGDGVSETSTTGSDGTYAFPDLVNGAYSITLSVDGYTFSTESLQVMISGNDVSAASITATATGGGTTPGDTTVVQGITLVSIPAGTFQMGTNSTDDSWFEHSRPVHSVTLSPFQMAQTEITQAQYEAVIGTNPSGFTGDNNRPVEQVSWYDAATFCNKLSELAGFEPCYNLSTWECDFTKDGFRLPTEAEWEYACRAGTTTKFYTGDSDSDLDRAGWYHSNSSGTTHHAVGGKEANSYGLYDMHGNVWEWCNDWWQDYYTSDSKENPKGPEIGSTRVRRGGGWSSGAYYCRSASRLYLYPDGSHYYIGFRVVLSGVFPQNFSN